MLVYFTGFTPFPTGFTPCAGICRPFRALLCERMFIHGCSIRPFPIINTQMKDTDEKTITTDRFSLSLSTSYVRFDKENGMVNTTEGIRHLKGALYLDVLSLCADKERTCFELIDLLKKSYPSPYIWHAVTVLEENRYLYSVENEERYIHLKQIEEGLQFEWKSCSDKDIPLVSVLSDITSEKARLDYTQAKESNRNWLPVVIGGAMPFVGPVFTSAGPCLECLCFRIRENQSKHTWVKRNAEEEFSNPEWIETEKLAGYAEKIRAYSARWAPEGQLKNSVLALSSEKELVYAANRRPECKECGDPSLVSKLMHQPIELEQAAQTLDFKQAYRSSSHEEIWDRMSHLISPITGILGTLQAIPETDTKKYPVYSSDFSIIPQEVPTGLENFKMFVFGKGRNEKAAQVSALCEGIERASARYRGDEPIICASIKELGAQAVSPLAIQHFTAEQIQQPEATLSLGPTPSLFDPEKPIDWLPAWSIRYNERRYLPADTVLHQQKKKNKERVAVFESNGLSAGNTKEEAILQGFLELIERDAVAIWWFNRLRRPSIDLDLMRGDSWFMQTIENLNADGTEVYLLDLTIDTKIPVVAAVGKSDKGWLAGFGCHFDPRIASSRALSELVQVRALMKPVPAPDVCPDTSYLVPDPNTKPIVPDRRYLDLPKNTNTFIELGVDLLAQLGIDTIVINCTRPDVDMPVVKVYAPGLRAFRPRFAPGRLYDLPVQMGQLPVPRSFAELNPLWLTA